MNGGIIREDMVAAEDGGDGGKDEGCQGWQSVVVVTDADGGGNHTAGDDTSSLEPEHRAARKGWTQRN